MNPVHFLFPSANTDQFNDNYDSCGCTGLNDDEINCNEFEEDEPKINSEIIESGEPYKEIEVIINNNRMLLRIQKLSNTPKEEWEPPCDCLLESKAERNESKSPEISQNMKTFPMHPTVNVSDETKSKNTRPGMNSLRPIDLVENPNMFLLRIRKRSETGDKKRENIDLEFRTPRPWLPKPIKKKIKSFREEYQEQKENQVIITDNDDGKKKGKKSKK